MNKKLLIEWYKENGVDNVVEEATFNHFSLPITNNVEIINKPKTLNQNIKTASITIENKVKIEAETATGDKLKLQAKETQKFSTDGENKQEFNFNYIYQNLANKYKKDNMKIAKEKTISIDEIISKARELANNCNSIEELRKVVENFDGYIDIKNLATNTVFGEGNINADIHDFLCIDLCFPNEIFDKFT